MPLKRSKIMASIQDIPNDNYPLEEVSVNTGFLGILILIFSVMISATATCWPLHNVIQQPEYWYEPIFQIMMTRLLPLAAKNIVEINLLFKGNITLSWKSYFQHYAFLSIGSTVLFVTEYTAWVKILGYKPPMPFQGQVHLGLMYLLVIPFALWTIFPSSEKSKQSTLKKKIVSYIFLFLFRGVIGILYSKLPAMFFMREAHIEWVLIIFLPIMKRVIVWIHRKIVMRVTNGDKITSNINTIIVVGFMHSFSLTLLLGSQKIDFATSCMMILSDFGLNTWCLLLKIIRSGKYHNRVINEQQDHSLKYLALKEFLEILVPSAFCVSFAIAYNGPSAELIGNVKGNCWMFKKVRSLIRKLGRISIFIAIDLFRALSFGYILSHYCKKSLYDAYCCVVKKYGFLILSFGSTVINGVIFQ